MSRHEGAAPATRLRCRTCGSTATHSRVVGMPTPELAQQLESTPSIDMGGCLVVPGMTSAQCLTCGARDVVDQTHESGFDEVPAPDLSVAEAITHYASTCVTTDCHLSVHQSPRVVGGHCHIRPRAVIGKGST